MRFGFELTTRRNLRVARCLLPQRQDIHPSFTIYPDQRFHCFGCGSAGDVIDLVSMMRGRSLSETTRDMAWSRTPGRHIPTPRAPSGDPGLDRSIRTPPFSQIARIYWRILRSHSRGYPGRTRLSAGGIDPSARNPMGLRLGCCPDAPSHNPSGSVIRVTGGAFDHSTPRGGSLSPRPSSARPATKIQSISIGEMKRGTYRTDGPTRRQYHRDAGRAHRPGPRAAQRLQPPKPDFA